MKDIGAELDAIADGAEEGRAFEQRHRLPVTCERERGGEPAEPAADDQNGFLQRQITLLFPFFSSVRRLTTVSVALERVDSGPPPAPAAPRLETNVPKMHNRRVLDWKELKIFPAVARNGSTLAAAGTLGRSQSTVQLVECGLLTGTLSAQAIMASVHVNRALRPNTWLHRPGGRQADVPQRVAGAKLRCSLSVRRQDELKDGTLGYIRRSPHLSAMSFDDRTADR
jgi:hypothetical protein